MNGSNVKVDEAKIIRKYLTSTKALAFTNSLLLAGGLLLVYYMGDVLTAIGTSLIASSFVNYSALLVRWLRTEEEKLLSKIREFGIENINEDRTLVDRYAELLKKVDDIDVTGYSLSGFTNQSLKVIKERIENGEQLRVRILLVDPSCDASKTQEKNESQPEGQFLSNCDNVVKSFEGLEGVTIKFINQALPIMIYRLGNTMFTGHYSVIQKSRSASTVTYELSNSGKLFLLYKKEFEEMWEIASSARGIEC